MPARNAVLVVGAVLASFALASPLALSADDPTAQELAARAAKILDDPVSPDFDQAEKCVEESLRKNPRYSPALLQKARLVMMRGGESEESLRQAELLLQQSRNNDFNYGPAYVMMGSVYMKLNRPGDAAQALFRARQLVPNDPDFLFANAQYLEAAGAGDPLPFYERFLASDSPRKSERVDAAHKLLEAYLPRGERAKADAAFEVLEKLTPNSAMLEGDYARGVMMFYADFDAGEKHARRALALYDYPHARASLSLALYGKWARARRDRQDPAVVASLLSAAQANDPAAAHVPSCSLEAPKLAFVKQALESLGEAGSSGQRNC